jgi:glycosyltransferase involved in cell wall biosynthesis
MKQYFPIWLKKLPWFLFKSPQREAGMFLSLLTEIKGLISLLTNILNPKKQALNPISICTGIKNRTTNYIQFVLGSVLTMENLDLIELSIYDCGSVDVEQLEKTIRANWKGKLVFHSEDHPFERSYSFNKAIGQSSHELIFACDADMALPPTLVKDCNHFVSKHTVWFPVCFDLKKNAKAEISNESGFWRYAGKGMFASTRDQFFKVGKYDEKFKTWGREDDELWLRFYKHGILPLRNKCIGLFHHYHEK